MSFGDSMLQFVAPLHYKLKYRGFIVFCYSNIFTNSHVFISKVYSSKIYWPVLYKDGEAYPRF